MAGRIVERGERVVLRRLSAGDGEEFVHRARASRALHRPWASPPTTAAGFEEYLRRARRADTRMFLVCRAGEGDITGVVTISQIFLGNFRSAYLGYYAFEPFAGRGYMREGLRLVMRHAFGTMGLHRLEANVQPGNVASIRLVEGLGFRREGFSERYLKIGGRWRDHLRFAIVAEDFFAQESARRAEPH
ncbi:MAG TPA: GNAT family protein [Actinomycetota bacterium]|jgi:ribosomal-protein-alanine N-acetyltransferase|nr:GNAT family protein [Actinomycetota bacterium]